MSNLKHKDAGDQEVLGLPEKPTLSTAEGHQLRNASAGQIETVQKTNPNASDGSVKNWALMTQAEKLAHAEQDGQGESFTLVDRKPSGHDQVLAARQYAAGVILKSQEPLIAQNLSEVDNRPIKDYDYEVKQHGQGKVIETGVQYQVEKLPEVTEQSLFERIGALPLDQQAQVLGAGIKAYSGEMTHQQFRIGVGAIAGLGDGVVGLAESAESLGKTILDVAQFSRDVMANDPAAVETAGKAGESLGKLMVSGIHVIGASDAYLGSLGAATTVGDYGKVLRDVSWLAQQMNSRWESMSPEEKTRLVTKLATENLGGLAVGFGTDKLAKSIKITETLEALGTEASTMGSGAREKARRLISQMADELLPQPMGVTLDGRLMPIPKPRFELSAKDLVAEKRLYQSPDTGIVHTPGEAKAITGLDKRLGSNDTAKALGEQGWSVIEPKVYHVEGVEKPLTETAMANRLGKTPEQLRAVTKGELEKQGITAIEPVRGSLPINHEFAGKVYKLEGDLGRLYPDGVRFSKTGYPDFSPYVKEVRPGVKASIDIIYSGSRTEDFRRANQAMGWKKTPKDYTWHHHENARTMQLVPHKLHLNVKHTGGCATSGLKYPK